MAMSFEERAAKIANALPSIGRFERRERLSARIREIRPEGRYIALELEVGEEWMTSHSRPSQYISLLSGDEPRFFVLTNLPGEPWTLLIEPTVEMSAVISTWTEGDYVGISEAEGPGFPVERAGPVMLIASGSAIASVRSVWKLLADGVRPLRILYGEAEVDGIAYREELSMLAELDNVEIDIVPPGLLAEAVGVGTRARYSAFICGSPGRMQVVAEQLIRHGINEQAIFTNL